MKTDKDVLMKHYVSTSSYTVISGLLYLLLVVLLIKLPQGDLHYLCVSNILWHPYSPDSIFHFSQKIENDTILAGRKIQSIQLAAEIRTSIHDMHVHPWTELENQFHCNFMPCPGFLIIIDALECCEQYFKWDLSRSEICALWKDCKLNDLFERPGLVATQEDFHKSYFSTLSNSILHCTHIENTFL